MPIYKCYNRTQHKELCDGPTTYRSYKIDNVIRELLNGVFDNVKGAKESDLIDQKFQEQLKEYAIQLNGAQRDHDKKSKKLLKLDEMMIEASLGTNGFTPERLMRRMDVVESELNDLKTRISDIREKITQSAQLVEQIRGKYKQLISWADVFSGASSEMQKMIASYMIKNVMVSRDYEIEVEYNFDENQFTMGLGM